MFDLRSLVLDLATVVQFFKAYIQSLKMSYQTCSIDIFVDLQLFDSNLKGRPFDFMFAGKGRRGVGIGPFDSPP